MIEPHDDPIQHFRSWFEAAAAAGVHEPEAMTLATADAAGRPSARMVLLRRCDARGFCFFTNYESRKARELTENDRAALVFYWHPVGRQVRVAGRVARLALEESEDYWRTRSRASRISAWSSSQSRPLADRAALEARVRETEERFGGEEVPLPPFWGGYRLFPETIEFWEQGDHRLHDRLRYARGTAGAWTTERLFP